MIQVALTERFPIARFIAAFVRTRWLARRLRSRAQLQAWQKRRLARWLARDVPRLTFYANLHAKKLDDLPIVDKAALMSRFEAFNQPGFNAEECWRFIHSKTPPDGYAVGASTGTSGNRGLYVISASERYEWLGTILAKTLPGFPVETARIALILPMNSALYSAANCTRRLSLQFLDLNEGIEAVAHDIIRQRPDTIIAPPRVLRWLAENDRTLCPKRVFSVAEVLDPLDRAIITARYGKILREI